MFSTLYESCLENVFLARLSVTPPKSESNVKTESPITTLGDVVRLSRHVLFCLFRSSSPYSLEFINSVRNFVAVKNGNSSRKNSSSSSPAKLKKLFGLRRKKKSITTVDEISVVLIDLEPNIADFNVCQITESGFYFLPDSQQYTTKSRLLRSLNFSGAAPALIVVDALELTVTTTQGRRMLQEDPHGENFPWSDPQIFEIFNTKYLRNVRNPGTSSTFEEEDFSTLKPCVKGLYFGAKWCPPCRVISKQLITFYEKSKEKQLNFEIFFCSSDRSEESFREHFSSMPWLAFPYDADKLAQLTCAFDISGIPSFILLDEENQLISRHGRSVLMSDPSFKDFPWKRAPIYELTEFTVQRIADYTSLILFTEGSPDDNEFSQQILKPCADLLCSQVPTPSFLQSLKPSVSNGNGYESNNSLNQSITQQQVSGESSNNSDSANDDHNSVDSIESIPTWADPIQVFFTGEDPICDYILESIGQGQADLPLLVICDILAGHLAICDKPDVSEKIVFDFVSEYRRGKANVIPLPPSAIGTASEDKRVDGVPVNLIEQIIHDQQQNLHGSAPAT